MAKKNEKYFHSDKTMEEFNVVLDRITNEVKMLREVFHKYYEMLIEPFLKENDFETCYEILDLWDDRNTKVHKYHLVRQVEQAEAKYRLDNNIEVTTAMEFLDLTGFELGTSNPPTKRDLKQAFDRLNVTESVRAEMLKYFGFNNTFGHELLG